MVEAVPTKGLDSRRWVSAADPSTGSVEARCGALREDAFQKAFDLYGLGGGIALVDARKP